MRIAFQRRPDDLIATVLLSTFLAGLAFSAVVGIIRVVFGLVFILLPGYALTATLFPRAIDLDWIDRFAVSAALSVSIITLIGLTLNFTPWGIFPEPAILSILLFTYLVGGAAWWRRARLPVDQRLALSLRIALPDFQSYSRVDRLLALALVASVVLSAGVIGYTVVTPRPGDRYTELYWLNQTGTVSGGFTNLTTNQTRVMHVIVHNVEQAEVEYELEVEIATLTAYFNASANRTDYRVVSVAPISNYTFILGNDGYWNLSYTLLFQQPGVFRMYFYLYKLPDAVDVYEYLFTTVFVNP